MTTGQKTKAPAARRGPQARPAEPRRRRPLVTRRNALLAAGALLLAAALVAASLLSARGTEETAASPGAVEAPASYLDGIPQEGAFLGDPDAPFVLVEYADVQCPYCAQYALNVLPGLVERYVRDGQLRLEYRGLAFLGPDSEEGLRAVLAAGEQDRLWNVLHGLYGRQGAENSDWITTDLLRSVGASVPGLDVERLLAGPDDYAGSLARAQEQASADGVRGTPSFTIAPREGGTPIRIEPRALELEAFAAEIDAAIAR